MANKKPILEALAKELGVKVEDLNSSIKNAKNQKNNTLQERLLKGEGIGQAIKGNVSEKIGQFKENYLTVKGIKKGIGKSAKKFGNNLLDATFGQNTLASAYVRGKISPKKDAAEDPNNTSPSGISNNDALGSIVNSSMALPGIARDMNILRQNISSLAKLERKTEEQQDLSKQGDFFKEQGQEEANLESGRQKSKESGKATVMKKGVGKEDGGGEGFLGGIIGSLKDGLLGSLGSLFNPMALLKLLGKAFAIGALLYSLFEGITAGFKKWQETGDLGEAIIAGLGAMLDFITFGLFGEEQLKELIGKIGDVIGPIIDSIKETYYSMKDWIANNVGINKHTFFKGTPAEFSIGPYYPFKKDSSSEAKQDTAGEFKAQRMEEKVQKETQKATDFIGGVTKDLKGGVDSVAKEINSNGEKLTSLVKDLPKDKKGQIDIFNNMNALTEKNLDNIKKLNKQGDYSLGRAEDYEKNVVQPIRDNLDKAKTTFQKGPEGGFDKMLSDSMGKAGQTISGKISAGGPTENSLGGGASMLGGGGGSSPTPTGSASSAGSDISKASSGVAEGQRMESSANMGSTINSPTTNNSSGSSGQKITPPPADTYNMEFLNLLART
jgi:hypothetical protein